MKSIELLRPKTQGDISIETALQRRRSVRKYGRGPVTLAEVSQLLWAAQGLTDARDGLRTAASAGALYPLELYLVAGRVEDLPEGVYRYAPRQHRLLKTRDGDRRGAVAEAAWGQSWLRNAAAVLVVSAVYQRTTAKYGQRGIRYVHMEAGHAAQNVYLQVVSLGLATVVLGAFDEKRVQEALGLGEDPLYLMPLGRLID